MIAVDHLAVTAATLDAAVALTEEALGLALAPGGRHPDFGTWNRLLSLGPGEYLEAIAIDPGAPSPGRARWFGLDDWTGPAALTHWICRTGDLEAALAAFPEGAGDPVDLERGDYRWRMTVPETGHLPFQAACPALIQWQGDRHPASALPDAGCRLHRLEIAHPEALALRAVLDPVLSDPRIAIVPGAEKALRAEIDTPHGRRVLA